MGDGLLDAALAHDARIGRLYGETARGRPVLGLRYRELDRRLFGLGMQRGALFALLDAAWREGRAVRCGRRIVAMDRAAACCATPWATNTAPTTCWPSPTARRRRCARKWRRRRVLSGTRRGWLGRLAFEPGFLDALAAPAAARPLAAVDAPAGAWRGVSPSHRAAPRIATTPLPE